MNMCHFYKKYIYISKCLACGINVSEKILCGKYQLSQTNLRARDSGADGKGTMLG